MSADRDHALALQVGLQDPRTWPTETCVAWVEPRGTCGRPRAEGLLCKRHHGVAERRWAKHVEQEARGRAERTAYRERMLPQWREELARVEARMAQLDPPRPHDRAAYTGNVHPAIRRSSERLMSGSRVQKMAALVRRADELRSLIGGDR